MLEYRLREELGVKTTHNLSLSALSALILHLGAFIELLLPLLDNLRVKRLSELLEDLWGSVSVVFVVSYLLAILTSPSVVGMAIFPGGSQFW